MKYKFRLQKLLDMRIDREDESKVEFQKAQSERLKVKENLTSWKKNMMNIKTDLCPYPPWSKK